jgi:hypothetical protein
MNRKLSNRKYYLKNKEKLKQKSKEYREDNKDHCKERDKVYYLNNKPTLSSKASDRYFKNTTRVKRKDYLKRIVKPLHLWKTASGNTIKKKARILLQRAVRKGRIIKPCKCVSCKRELPKKLIHGHHEDYNKWWDVIWLCQSCHSELHLKLILIKDKD